VETLDLMAEVLTSEQWAELLKAPLERAVGQGKTDLAHKLMRAGAETAGALHTAAQGGHEEIVKYLLGSGAASVAEKDETGRTPLHVAALWGRTEVVHLLLLRGADRDALNNNGRTPLFLATTVGQTASALVLLAAGADANIRSSVVHVSKESAVDVAAKEGHVSILRAAIEHGGHVNTVGSNMGSPLDYAAANGHAEAIDVLVEAGANVKARGRGGRTSLHHAADGPVARALLKHGADINARDESSQTPLHHAVGYSEYISAELVDLLLRSGADETITDAFGRTAEDMLMAWLEGQDDEYEELLEDEDDEENYQAEDANIVRQLLASAPADKAWRRRGYLVLCRAYPDRVQGEQTSRRRTATHRGTLLARAEEGVGTGTEGDATVSSGGIGGNWTDLVARVLRLQEEGVFRMIVGYL